MLHQDKGHARILLGHGGEKSFERRQPPGRRADADDRESGALLLSWSLDLLWIDYFARRLRGGLCFGHDPVPSISASSPFASQIRAHHVLEASRPANLIIERQSAPAPSQ